MWKETSLDVLSIGGISVFLSIFILLLASFQIKLVIAPAMPIEHIIVLMEENRLFDHHFGNYPEVNCLEVNGLNGSISLPVSSASGVTIRPFHMDSTSTRDPSHAHSVAVEAFDGGKMDGFVYAERSKLTMGYYDDREISYYWDYASKFVLLDNFFSSELGPSLPSHLYLIAGHSGSLLENAAEFSLNFKVIMDELDSRGIS